MEKETVNTTEPQTFATEDPSVVPDDSPEEVAAEVQAPKKKPLRTFFLTGGLFTVVGLIIAAAATLPGFFSYAKSVSDLKLNLINQDNRYVYSDDTLRISVNNESDDDKYLTKAVVHVTWMRNDDTPEIFSLASLSKNGLNINICNIGWSDLNNVLVEADPDAESYQNLKYPEKLMLKLDTMHYGQPYVVGELTLDDLKDPTASVSVSLRCKVNGEQEYYKTSCGFGYNTTTDKLFRLSDGKGGDTYIQHIKYCIPCDQGKGDYTLPLEYTCPAHKYEEIHFAISADRSCYASYYVELYAMDKLLLKTEEMGAHFTTHSFDIYSIPDSPDA